MRSCQLCLTKLHTKLSGERGEGREGGNLNISLLLLSHETRQVKTLKEILSTVFDRNYKTKTKKILERVSNSPTTFQA